MVNLATLDICRPHPRCQFQLRPQINNKQPFRHNSSCVSLMSESCDCQCKVRSQHMNTYDKVLWTGCNHSQDCKTSGSKVTSPGTHPIPLTLDPNNWSMSHHQHISSWPHCSDIIIIIMPSYAPISSKIKLSGATIHNNQCNTCSTQLVIPLVGFNFYL